ncbi:4'-phosphopantetheinyl transferase family protein [Mariniflexile gromovii]|uniref:4'-phosphopantetheinyl transferase superfamily protein n=1 Tax=Mariniflexile gromovii TaxID=362523 RepID=A0ABS4BUH3_9FLAO|nr:4'-phosphopantetheinyl transferase superfamily protein [Mariniflexile gromovii]MBP0903702.1 4'-phosphopantetheinyl transferase superfamily protein [Mariniflexile gromovii]
MPTSKILISFSNVKSVKSIPNKETSFIANDSIIYSIYLPDFLNLESDLKRYLNLNEIGRAERFHRDIDRHRFIIYRAILKFILAAYTKLDVRTIAFDYHSNKKPYLASHPWLQFNSSHAEDYALIAISRKKIGIDIEHMSDDFNFNNLIQNVFGKEETSIIQNAVNKKQTFYTLWTRKEAFVKGIGKGIDDDFRYIPCLDGQHEIPSGLIQNTEDWQVCSFNVGNHYLAAVAMEGSSTYLIEPVLFTVPNTMKGLLKMAQLSID